MFHREQTGQATELDVSLLSIAWWSTAASLGMAIETRQQMRAIMPQSGAVRNKPFVGDFTCADGGVIHLATLTPGPYISDLFDHLGIPAAARDDRFSTAEALRSSWVEAGQVIAEASPPGPLPIGATIWAATRGNGRRHRII